MQIWYHTWYLRNDLLMLRRTLVIFWRESWGFLREVYKVRGKPKVLCWRDHVCDFRTRGHSFVLSKNIDHLLILNLRALSADLTFMLWTTEPSQKLQCLCDCYSSNPSIESSSSFTQPSYLQRAQHCDNGSGIYQQTIHVRGLFPHRDCRPGPDPAHLDNRLHLP